MSYYGVVRSPDYLEHFGILGMKWGIRRYQNPDGSLTEEGKKRYGDRLTKDQMKNMVRDYNIRTGSNAKLNKKTVFKTKDGMYDHKGRRLDTETEIDNPTEKAGNKPKKVSDMSYEELKEANARMREEIDYLKNIKTLNPEKVSAGKRFVNNLKNGIIDELPKGIARGLSDAAKNSLAESGKTKKDEDDSNNGQNQQKKQQKKQQTQEKNQGQSKPANEQKPEPKPEPRPETPKQNNSNAMDYFNRRLNDIPSSPAPSVMSNPGVSSTRVSDIDYDDYSDMADAWKNWKR